MKVYISGRISGLHPELAKDVFEQAETQLLSYGHEPVNPLKNGLPPDASYEEHLCKDIYLLTQCEAIYMLKGWKRSKGARIEHKIAEEYDLDIIEQPDYAVHPVFKEENPAMFLDYAPTKSVMDWCRQYMRPPHLEIIDDQD